jgi:hypothetical protein
VRGEELLVAIVVCGCWSSSTPDASKPRRVSAPFELLPDLSAGLRSGDIRLTSLITGPIVVLDTDAGTITMLCGADAVAAAASWSAAFVDPALSAPICSGGGRLHPIDCDQFNDRYGVVIDVGLQDKHRLIGAIVSASGVPNLGAYFGQYKQALRFAASAQCPTSGAT